MREHNPRFVRFAASLGKSPSEVERGAGANIRFMEWVHARWREWRGLRGVDQRSALSEADHADFDAWLAERYPVAGPSAREYEEGEVPKP